jgi:hypothetical protein
VRRRRPRNLDCGSGLIGLGIVRAGFSRRSDIQGAGVLQQVLGTVDLFQCRLPIEAGARGSRDLVNAKAEEGREYVIRQGAKLADQTNEFVERSKRAVSEQKEKVASAVEAGKFAYRTTDANPENSEADI